MSILPKTIYTFNATPTKIPAALFTETEQRILTFLWSTKDPEQPRGSWERRAAAGGNSLPDFKPYYKGTLSKQCRNSTERGPRTRGTEQSPEISPHTRGQLTDAKAAKDIQQGKDTPLNKPPGKWNITSPRGTLDTVCTTHKTHRNPPFSTPSPSSAGSSED